MLDEEDSLGCCSDNTNTRQQTPLFDIYYITVVLLIINYDTMFYWEYTHKKHNVLITGVMMGRVTR